MNSTFKKATIKLTIVVLALTLPLGCSSKNNPIKTTDNGQTQKGAALQTVPSRPSTDSTKELLLNMMQLAKQGKVINCEYTAKTTVFDNVEKAWGKADKTENIATAKGRYATFASHNVVFGINKGEQIFEVRSFDNQLKSISLSKVKEVFGTPPYDVKSSGQEIIGYTAGSEYKIEVVFPQPTNDNPNPVIDHYNVLYPRGTVNMMADDPGKQW